MCRSRRQLSNEYVLSKFGFDTAENAPCKVCPLSVYRSPRCNVNAVPNCPLLNDAISTMVGELRDVFVKEKTAYETQLAECNKVSVEYEAQIKDWEGIHDQAEVTLAQAITQIDTNQAEMEAKETEATFVLTLSQNGFC